MESTEVMQFTEMEVACSCCKGTGRIKSCITCEGVGTITMAKYGDDGEIKRMWTKKCPDCKK